MIDLRHRHLLVVGGTGTIGSAVVDRALAQGASVTGTASRPSSLPQSGAAEWRVLDVTDGRAVAELVGELDDLTDIVVAGAARPFGGLVDMSDDDLTALVDTKLWGAFHVGRAAAGLPPDGTLTYISGTLAAYPDAAVPVAAVSAAVETLARGLAVELAPVRVNAVSPEALGTAGRGTHVGTATDVADAILSTITNEWMSGAIIELHGAGRP